MFVLLTHPHRFPPIHLVHVIIKNLLPMRCRHGSYTARDPVQKRPQRLNDLPINVASPNDECRREFRETVLLMSVDVEQPYAPVNDHGHWPWNQARSVIEPAFDVLVVLAGDVVHYQQNPYPGAEGEGL